MNNSRIKIYKNALQHNNSFTYKQYEITCFQKEKIALGPCLPQVCFFVFGLFGIYMYTCIYLKYTFPFMASCKKGKYAHE